MDWTWTASLDQLWRAPTFPIWLTLAAAAFFAVLMVMTLLRADRSVANGALTVITLLAVAVAAAATMRGFGAGANLGANAGGVTRVSASLPALSCMDDLAGDEVETACEKILFRSPDNVAAAVSYAAAQIGTLMAGGGVNAASRVTTPERQSLRRAVERDRYGLVAHVLMVRDRCTASDCAAFQSLTDHNQIVANMEGRIYDALVARYAPSWSAATNPAAAVDAAHPAPTGKPTNADFPTSASIPPVNIMTPEPPVAAAPAPSPRPAAAPRTQPVAHPSASARRRPAPTPKPPVAAAVAPPVQLTPPTAAATR